MQQGNVKWREYLTKFSQVNMAYNNHNQFTDMFTKN